jgi:hypothetical protein
MKNLQTCLYTENKELLTDGGIAVPGVLDWTSTPYFGLYAWTEESALMF